VSTDVQEQWLVTSRKMRTGQRVATDSITLGTLHGKPFPVILHNQSYKHLRLRMTTDRDFSDEKEHVGIDIRQRLEALAEDRVDILRLTDGICTLCAQAAAEAAEIRTAQRMVVDAILVVQAGVGRHLMSSRRHYPHWRASQRRRWRRQWWRRARGWGQRWWRCRKRYGAVAE
jgi:hypothetical protein